MHYYGSLSVNPKLPEEIKGLKELSYNLWWCWNPEAESLFKEIDAKLWVEVEKNPIKLLSKASYKDLKEIAKKENFLKRYKSVMGQLKDYLAREDTWFNNNFDPLPEGRVIAYFSAEFGIHESLPIYSGGLGVLAGDHCKSASDIGIPFAGVGLLYRNGYFRQKINAQGWQKAIYPELDFEQLPIKEVKGENGEDLIVSVKLDGRDVDIKVWQVKVGRVSLYLLDTDLRSNNLNDRNLTSRLYGGGSETRISQEIILGIGGTRALYKLGYRPGVWHMNEGHSVYLGLERIRNLIKKYDFDFYGALEKVGANTVFTTHTPVPAGNEVFSFDLKDKYFSSYWKDVGLNRGQFMKLGMKNSYDKGFGLTVLALRLARFSNGVSKLHGKISSDMWEELWSGVPTEENPITYITNGIHTLTWLAPEWKGLLDNYLPNSWRDNIKEKEIWEKVVDIPHEEFWSVHRKLKSDLIEHIRERDLRRRERCSNLNNLIRDDSLLDKDMLTIGFARRFATYKRANLIFKDIERLKKICNKKGKEVQIIFAGKAHPADIPGQEFIKDIYNISQSKAFKGRIVILEDYDMNLARYLVQGVDVWLNNPRRPLEASGTSGQKVGANGGLNFSVLDGWWCEGYNRSNGWTIGYKSQYSNREEQDILDSNSLYKTLEEEIVPLYYDRDGSQVSLEWVDRMKEAMISNAPRYSTDRMVQEYTQRLYMPAYYRGEELRANNYQKALELAAWKSKLRSNWDKVKVTSDTVSDMGNFNLKENIEFKVRVYLGKLKPEDIRVELYLVAEGKEDTKRIQSMDSIDYDAKGVASYGIEINLDETGDYRYSFRVIPNPDSLASKHEIGLIKWI